MTVTVLIGIASGVGGALGVLALWGIWRAIARYEGRVQALEAEQVKHQGQITKLEEQVKEVMKGKRHTYRTSAGLEDATAVVIDVAMHQRAEAARLQQALEILRELREGPQNYDPDRPAGSRPKGWDAKG
jgi:hypothetical protein